MTGYVLDALEAEAAGVVFHHRVGSSCLGLTRVNPWAH